MKATIKICKAKNGEYYLSVTAINGRKLFHTETYKRHRYAETLAARLSEQTGWTVKDKRNALGKV